MATRSHESHIEEAALKWFEELGSGMGIAIGDHR